MRILDIVKKNLAWSGVMAAAVFCTSAMTGNTAIGAVRTVLQADVAAGTVATPTERGTLTCTTDKTNVNITGTVSGAVSDPAVYDNYWYLFEMQPYEDEIGARTDYAAWWTKGDAISLSLIHI